MKWLVALSTTILIHFVFALAAMAQSSAEIVFITTIQAATDSWASSVVFDVEGNLVLAGGAQQGVATTNEIVGSNHSPGLSSDGFLVKVDGTTGEILFSARFGGDRRDAFTDMELDQTGNMYLTGYTESDNFPLKDPVQDSRSNNDENAFLTILSPDYEILYSTYLGGDERDRGTSLALDGMGGVYVLGQTGSSDLSTEGSFQTAFSGGDNFGFASDAFVAKFNSSGTIDYVTYLGGSGDETGCGISADVSGEVTMSAFTTSPDYPVANAAQSAFGGGVQDLVITRLNADGSQAVFSSYYGTENYEECRGFASSDDGRVSVVGYATTLDPSSVEGLPPLANTDSADALLVSFGDDGSLLTVEQSSIPGFDTFQAIDFNETNTALITSESRDSLRILEKLDGAPSTLVFSSELMGLRIQDVRVQGGLVAAAGGESFGFGAAQKGMTTISDSSGLDLMTLLLSFGVTGTCRFEDGRLEISVFGQNGETIVLGVNDQGKVTVNGIPKDIAAAEVKEIEITGAAGKDAFDTSGVSVDDFPQLDQEGRRVILRGREEDDHFTINTDVSIDVFGGPGNDTYAISATPPPNGAAKRLTLAQAVVKLSDTEGRDTVDFAGHTSGIALDLSIQGAEQTVDSAGTVIVLSGDLEVMIGTQFDDQFTVTPLVDAPRHVDGNGGSDLLILASPNGNATDDGSTITTPGFADVTYSDVESVHLIAATAVERVGTVVPASFELGQNYPNPFSSSTSIRYDLPAPGHVRLNLYNLVGQEVTTLVDAYQSAGSFVVTFDASDLASGSYLYLIRAGEVVRSRQMSVRK